MIRFLAVAAVLLFPSLSYGCECMISFPDNEQALLDEAAYYGYFDVLDVQMPDWSGAAPRILKATLKPAKQYGETPPDVLKITSDLYTNCGKVVQKDKQEHLLVFKNDGGYYLKGICSDLSEKAWASFDKDVLDYKAYYNFATTLDHEKHVLSLDKFKEMSYEENIVILDLRTKQAYDAGHMKGALHVGADITQNILKKLIPSKETTVLTYCTNSLVLTRMIALTDIVFPQIYALGYHNIYSLQSATLDNDFDDKNRREKLNFIYPAE
ncbi:MAG: hypothetical protein COB14_01475 [Alphaproteobacteria bacterium]|nr:MAG: hypothetical protein COB14_01475 [Alphaproteobacteria bacterium]